MYFETLHGEFHELISNFVEHHVSFKWLYVTIIKLECFKQIALSKRHATAFLIVVELFDF